MQNNYKEAIQASFVYKLGSALIRYLVLAYHFIYRVCYITGVQTMRVSRYAKKRVVRIAVPMGRFLFNIVDWLLLRHIRRLTHGIISESRRFAQGFPLAVRRVKEEYHRHPLHAVRFSVILPFLAARRHRKAIFTLINLAAPVAAAFLLVSTINYWTNMTFALAVEYDGQTLGYVADESVYDAAATMATERVINADHSFEVERVPKMTITVVSKSQILDESTVCDKILKSSSDSIAEVSGLYIDGKFEGAVQSRAELDGILQSIKNKYLNGSENERAEFVQDVQVVDGLFPISSIVSAQQMNDYLTTSTVVDKYYTVVDGDAPLLIAKRNGMTLAQLEGLNPNLDKLMYSGKKVLVQAAQPYLRVQVVRTVQYTESIDYETQKVQDSSQYIGYSAVRTAGKEGERSISAEVTYLDGVETSRTILSSVVTKEPVTKVVVVGARKVNQYVTEGDGLATGKFVWPLPSCRMISSGYGAGRGHQGIDISGNGVYGKDIIAADGGTVVEVNTSGWGGGYGLYVIIDHGGGYRTVYAHCSTILVAKGQKVSQGQLIAKAGNSGNSYGAHLHFEIRVNGRSVNPTKFLG